MISCRPVRISRAEAAAEAGMFGALSESDQPIQGEGLADCAWRPSALNRLALAGAADLQSGTAGEVEAAFFDPQAGAVAHILLGCDQEILGHPRQVLAHGETRRIGVAGLQRIEDFLMLVDRRFDARFACASEEIFA